MEAIRKNSPMWHDMQRIIQEVKAKGSYEEPSLMAINTFKDYAKDYTERKKLFAIYNLKLTKKGSNYIFELISSNS